MGERTYEQGVADERARLVGVVVGVVARLVVVTEQDLHALTIALLRALGGEPVEAVASSPPPRSRTQQKLEPYRDQLGKVPDAQIARAAGVSSSTVKRWRIALDIAATWSAKPPTLGPRTLASPPRVAPAWKAVVRDRLGKVEDAALAREVGLSRERIRQYRASLGIPMDESVMSAARAARKRRPLPDKARSWFGVLSDTEIATRLKCSTSQVCNWRLRHALPPPPPWAPKSRGSKLDAFVHLFGTINDSEIARQAGVTVNAVTKYRHTHPNLPPSPNARVRTLKQKEVSRRWQVDDLRTLTRKEES